MKKKILYIAAIVICLSILTGGTLAYFTAEDTATNVITSGGVGVALVEQQLVDGVLRPYPEEPILIAPGHTVSKIVSVRSTEQAAWIRASYTVTVFDADGKLMEIPAAELEKMIFIEPDATKWTLKDGWWYYNAAIDGGETTSPLFEEVSFSGPGIGNAYKRCTMEINVTTQAVQRANNGTTALEAAGWPGID